jgi:hypothetical protein
MERVTEETIKITRELLAERAGLIEQVVLKLEEMGWRFRVTRRQDRETVLSYPGQKKHATKLLYRLLQQDRRMVIEYLDRRAKKYIAICRREINVYKSC